ncbi:MAG: hypothetical protein N3G77_07105 [Nitrososphaeria archaeon]|nr:hypothetical protein [Nitrososphaeria archaeon]
MYHKIVTVIFIFLLTLSSLSILSVGDAQEEEIKIEWNRPIHFLGPQKTLVLMVEFSDVRIRASIQKVEEIVNIVNRFIKSSSYGKTWLDYYIYPKVITLPKNMAYYGGPSPGAQRGDDNARSLEFKYLAIKFFKEKSGKDITEFKHIIIVHAGGDEATSGSPNDIWSHCMMSKPLYLLGEMYGLDTIYEMLKRQGPEYQMIADILMHKKPDGGWHLIAGVETVAEEDVPSVMIHEFTHSMWIYDHYVYSKDGYSAGSEVGVWTNMDSGPFLDPPVDIDGWSKYLLGWIEAVEVKEDGEYIIHTLDKPDEPHGIIIPINEEEYYFIHARRPVGQDAALPSPGVLLFKINKYRSRNVEGEPYMVSLLDANLGTPPECKTLDKRYIRLCETLDAPYYDYNHYRGQWSGLGRLGSYAINLLTEEVTTEEGYYIKVTEFDGSKGIAKVYISLEGEPAEETEEDTEPDKEVTIITRTLTGTYTETIYTTVTTHGTVTKSIIVTVTVAPPPRIESFTDYLSIIIILAAVIIVFVMIIFRKKAPLPPPPPQYPPW